MTQDEGRRLFQKGRWGLPRSIFLMELGFSVACLPFPEHTFFSSQIGWQHFNGHPLRARHSSGNFSLHSHIT